MKTHDDVIRFIVQYVTNCLDLQTTILVNWAKRQYAEELPHIPEGRVESECIGTVIVGMVRGITKIAINGPIEEKFKVHMGILDILSNHPQSILKIDNSDIDSN